MGIHVRIGELRARAWRVSGRHRRARDGGSTRHARGSRRHRDRARARPPGAATCRGGEPSRIGARRRPGFTDALRAVGARRAQPRRAAHGRPWCCRSRGTGRRTRRDRAGDHHRAGVAERLLGLVAQARGDVPAARAALERSVALATDDPDPTASIAATTALALTLAAAGSVDEAIAIATRAADTCRRIGDRHLEAAVENHIADICHDAGRTEDSMAHLKRAVSLFTEVGEGAPEREPGTWALAAW